MWAVGAALGRAGRGRGLGAVANRSRHVEAASLVPGAADVPASHAPHTRAAAPLAPMRWSRGVWHVAPRSWSHGGLHRAITTTAGARITASVGFAAQVTGKGAQAGPRLSTSPDVEPLGDFEWDTLLAMQEFACDKYASRPLFGTKLVRGGHTVTRASPTPWRCARLPCRCTAIGMTHVLAHATACLARSASAALCPVTP